ncbi:uncharacterized protein LOC106170470 [Lingula anatina]|uniref:Uncharacterized protein LOC106170470 n=1 Tax=Lingula anatina TaxID=7574 RepID=A0A1S3J5U1_LINAN|nr:uncharacterized protein LOC106170470 [Lingula anatina]|eukprot:XP_013405787.1 uncharacterized protein LOC106170470 [Lingula anatina]
MCSGRIALGYVAWVLLGFMTGLHWLVFIPGLCLNPYRSYGMFSLCAILSHMIAYWVANVAFWVFRQTMLPWYIPCSGGEDMSPACLFNEQETRYTAFYVIHLILLLFMLIKWIVDGLLLWYWIRRSDQKAAAQDGHHGIKLPQSEYGSDVQRK